MRCLSLVRGLDDWYAGTDKDLTVLDVLVENAAFAPASVADAAAWRAVNDLGFPVLADSEEAWVDVWGNTHSDRYAQHSYTLLDPDGLVMWRLEENETFDNAVLDLVLIELEAL